MARWQLGLVLALLASCAGERQPPITVRPVVRPVVRDDKLSADVKLAGNAAFTAETLRDAIADTKCDARHEIEMIASHTPYGNETPACKSLEDLASTIEVYYQTHGYVAAKVHAIPGLVTIVEGGLFHVGSIDVIETGESATSDALGDPAAIKKLFVQSGQPFLRATLRAAMDRVQARYDAAGYALANVLPLSHVHLDTLTVDVKLEIDRGRIAKVAAQPAHP